MVSSKLMKLNVPALQIGDERHQSQDSGGCQAACQVVAQAAGRPLACGGMTAVSGHGEAPLLLLARRGCGKLGRAQQAQAAEAVEDGDPETAKAIFDAALEVD